MDTVFFAKLDDLLKIKQEKVIASNAAKEEIRQANLVADRVYQEVNVANNAIGNFSEAEAVMLELLDGLRDDSERSTSTLLVKRDRTLRPISTLVVETLTRMGFEVVLNDQTCRYTIVRKVETKADSSG